MRYGSPGELLERRGGRWGTLGLSTVREAVRMASGHGVSRPAGARSGTLSPRPVHTERPQPEPTGYADAVNTGQDGSWTGSTDGAGRWEQGHCRARQPRLEQQWARGPLGKQRLNSRWSRRASAFQKRSLWTSSGIGMGGSC